MLTREQLLDEAQKQKQALSTMGVWRVWLFVVTCSLFGLSVFALRGGGWLFVLGVVLAVLAVLAFLLVLLVNLSIRNGHRNVEKILDSLQSSAPDGG